MENRRQRNVVPGRISGGGGFPLTALRVAAAVVVMILLAAVVLTLLVAAAAAIVISPPSIQGLPHLSLLLLSPLWASFMTAAGKDLYKAFRIQMGWDRSGQNLS